MFFKNVKTGKRYEVLGFNQDAGEVTLKGEHATFTEKYSKERFKAMGYVPEKGE